MQKMPITTSIIVEKNADEGPLEHNHSYLIAACDFHDSAKLLAVADPVGRTRSIAFLGGQATECYLKALLCDDKITSDALIKKPYGHDLEKLWNTARDIYTLPDAPSWLHHLKQVHDKPYKVRYPMGLVLQAYPDTDSMLKGLDDLRYKARAKIEK